MADPYIFKHPCLNPGTDLLFAWKFIFSEYIECAEEGKYMSVVKFTEHSRAAAKTTFLAGSLGEQKNVALMFLSGVSTLQGCFFAAQMSEQPPKGRGEQFVRGSKSGI